MKDKPTVLYKLLRPILKVIFIILYHPKVINGHYIPKDGSAILAGNHKHNMDPFTVCYSTLRQVHFLAKKELFNKWTKGILYQMGGIPVDRKKKDDNAKKEVLESLKSNKLVGIFPEGTHNKTNDLIMPFKFGTVSFAQKTNCLIIPFAIKGKYKLFRKGLIIEFGKPIDIKNMTLDDANKLLENKVKELLLR